MKTQFITSGTYTHKMGASKLAHSKKDMVYELSIYNIIDNKVLYYVISFVFDTEVLKDILP